MDDDAIVVEIRLSDKEIDRDVERVRQKLSTALNRQGGIGKDVLTPRLRDQEAAALRLAQAQARLATAGGNLSQSQNILSTALSKTTRETITTVNAQTQLVRVNQQMERSTQQSAAGVNNLGSAISTLRGGFAAIAALGIGALFKNFAERSIEAAISIDRQVNSLQALTGSAEAARRRFADLVAIARQTPGLTTNLAATLDTQLRILNVSQDTINRVLPAVGRLNAISPITDPRQLVNNLTQLVTQGFERQDLKELVGQSPFAGNLIKEIFNVDNPTNAKAIRESARKLGINTVDEFFTAFARAAENNPRLQAVQESLASQFEKMQDRINVALAPIGDELLKTLLPATEKIVGLIEQTAPKITTILQNHQTEIDKTADAVLILAEYFGRYVGWISEAEKKFAILQHRFKIGFPILAGIVELINRIDRFANRPDPNNPLGARGGGIQTGRAVIVGDGPTTNTQVFPPGSGAPGIVDNRGQIFDRFGGKVIGRIPRPDDTKTNTGGGGAVRKPGINLPTLTADELITTQYLGMGALARTRLTPDQMRRVTGIPLGSPGAITGQPTITFQEDIDADAFSSAQNRIGLADQRLRIQQVQIQNQVTAGILSEAEAREQLNAVQAASRDETIALLEAQRDIVGVNSIQGLQITEQIESMRLLGVELSNTERFMRGFNSAIETVGDSFERFGQNVSRALLSTKDLLNGLKQSVLQLFNDLLGRSLQNLVRQSLGSVFGALGGIFGPQPGFAGAAGNIFRTAGTFPSSIAQAFAGDGGISVPASVTSSAGGLPIFRGNLPVSVPIANASGGVLAGTAARPGFFSSLGSSLASAAPFLGLGLGGSLGGQSTAGGILGAAGGFLGGGAVAGFSGALSAGAKAFFTNPFTIAIGAGLLVGSFFLGRAQQRRKDEEASGQFLTQALQGIDQLAAGIASGQIDGSQARQIFDSQILGTFRQQINGLQTKSVRESRLTNQVRDLENVFNARIPPLIAEQERKAADARRFAAIDSRLVPQFASGGFVPGIDRGRDSVLAFMRPGELVLNQTQQSAVRSMAGADVFDRAGVPRSPIYTGSAQAMATGGYAQSSAPAAINLSIRLGIGKGDALEILASATDSRTGQRMLVNAVEEEMGRRSN